MYETSIARGVISVIDVTRVSLIARQILTILVDPTAATAFSLRYTSSYFVLQLLII